MPITTLQRQLRTLGHIRTGIQVASADGKRKRPTKLDTFRLTSPSKALIEAAAAAYGGTVRPWEAQWEVVTEAASLDIIIVPGQPVSQWFELWSGGGCQRRCDGVTETLTLQQCLCPAVAAQRVAMAKEGQACKATTRLNVMLPSLPDLGSWLLTSTGYYAAVELAGAADVLALASANGQFIPAHLRLEQREKRVPGQPTAKYAVPVIEFTETRMADLALIEASMDPSLDRPMLRAPVARTVPALPATTLPPTSNLRAPLPVEPGVATAHCGAIAPGPLFVNGETCGLMPDHLDDPRATRQHRVLGPDGVVQGSWPAEAAS